MEKEFKYTDTVRQNIVTIVPMFIVLFVLFYIFSGSFKNSFLEIFLACIISSVVMIAIDNITMKKGTFEKSGNYYINDKSLYIKKGNHEQEVITDMVSLVFAAQNFNALYSSFELNIKTGNKTFKIKSKAYPNKTQFEDTDLFEICNLILENNNDLKQQTDKKGNDISVWK